MRLPGGESVSRRFTAAATVGDALAWVACYGPPPAQQQAAGAAFGGGDCARGFAGGGIEAGSDDGGGDDEGGYEEADAGAESTTAGWKLAAGPFSGVAQPALLQEPGAALTAVAGGARQLALFAARAGG